MANRIAVIRNGRIIYGESAETIQPSETSARENRQAMKTKHRADLLQPNQVDFYKVHPEQAKDLPSETQRLLS